MTLRYRIVNKAEFDKNMDKRFAKTLANVRRVVRVSANEVRNTAITSITANPRAGETVSQSRSEAPSWSASTTK